MKYSSWRNLIWNQDLCAEDIGGPVNKGLTDLLVGDRSGPNEGAAHLAAVLVTEALNHVQQDVMPSSGVPLTIPGLTYRKVGLKFRSLILRRRPPPGQIQKFKFA